MELDHESVYRLDPNPDGAWAIPRVTFDTTRPNGILFSLDYKSSTSPKRPPAGRKRQLRAYPMRTMARSATGRSAARFRRMARHRWHGAGYRGKHRCDSRNQRRRSGPLIYVFSPTGGMIELHPVPCKKPTNCSFGDADLRTLYVTSIDGHVFRAKTERRGRLLYPLQPQPKS